MITVLVTAKGGQLAQCIETLTHKYSNINFIFKSASELDITNKAQINSVFKSINNLDYCINCAAYTAVDKAETEYEFSDAVNHIGVQNLAEACEAKTVTLIHISTDFVFDGNALQPYNEDSITNPLGVYGETKLKGEHAITETLHNYFILRTSWLYSEFGNNFLKTMLRLSSERDEISVVSDQIGSPTYAKDLAQVILNIVKTKNISYGIYNYSNSGITSWCGFASEIFRLSSSSIKLNCIETKDYPTPAIRPKYSVLNTSKIEKALGIEVPNWKDSLVNAYANLKS